MTYQKCVMVDAIMPGYPQADATLSPSTVHRWITTAGQLPRTCRAALNLVLQENPALSICWDLARLTAPQQKYRTEHRKKQLIGCRHLVVIESFFQLTFKKSIASANGCRRWTQLIGQPDGWDKLRALRLEN
ncbi:MAG: hypothetical protein CR984_03560 [Proteobacteria bacterium]|nr:MAG: hypothetical protein CR984_03560 [Pseudomonadota bacterium]PIE67944.1 MAG: hypothetical protein CSA23_01445 [Deltaproteobacteria bacterium]